jgi:hypothetical protein
MGQVNSTTAFNTQTIAPAAPQIEVPALTPIPQAHLKPEKHDPQAEMALAVTLPNTMQRVRQRVERHIAPWDRTTVLPPRPATKEIDETIAVASASKIQRAWRQHQIRAQNRELNAGGLHEIAHPETGAIVGFTDPKESLPKPGERTTHAFWPNLTDADRDPSINPDLRGALKQLTHRVTNEDFRKEYKTHVGLTMHAERMSLPADELFTLSDKARKKVIELDLRHVVIQREIRPGFYVAPELEDDLLERANSIPMPFEGFLPFLNDLKTLHENGIVHRDIKLENLMVKNNVAYLTDLDTMDFADDLTPKALVPGTPEVHDAKLYVYLTDLIDLDQAAGAAVFGKYAKTMDNYATLVSMISNQSDFNLKENQVYDNYVVSDYVPGAREAVFSWFDDHVKPECINDTFELLTNPKSYSERYNGQPPHIIDLLKTS